jgi:hypothetical protein
MQDYAQQHGKGPQGVQFVEPATRCFYRTSVNSNNTLPCRGLQEPSLFAGSLRGGRSLDETRLEPLHCRVDLGLRDSEGRHDADELWAREVQEESASVACR